MAEILRSLDLYDLCGGDTKLVGVGLVLLYFGLLLAPIVTKNGQFCSHAHGNLILDIRSAVIRALSGYQSSLTVTSSPTNLLWYPVAPTPLHTCHWGLLSRVQYKNVILPQNMSLFFRTCFGVS